MSEDNKSGQLTKTVGKTLPPRRSVKICKSNGGPLIAIRISEEDEDVLELVKAAVRNGFAKTPAETMRRCARLFLMTEYGDNKRVQGAIEKRRRIRAAKGLAS